MSPTLPELGNHLWQSTAVAALAGLLALMLRKHGAHVRYWIWFTASVKFLVPFSLLISLGSAVKWSTVKPISPLRPMAIVATEIAQPFVISTPAALPPPSVGTMRQYAPTVLLIAWLVGFLIIVALWVRSWCRMRAIVRAASPVVIPPNIHALESSALLEPSIFGVLRPVLLVPHDIQERLSEAQLRSVLDHEMCHIRRRDNLLSSIHMTVAAIFWFYPVVWWLGARLLGERERACDEQVIRQGSDPQAYAEGILRVCKSYLESPLRCASGVTGSDLNKRIRKILSGAVECNMTFAKKALLGIASVAAIAGPITVGVLNARLVRADALITRAAGQSRLTFEVASVKPVDRALMTRNHEGNRLDQEVFIDRTDLYAYIVEAYIRGGMCGLKVGLGEVCPFIAGALPSWVRADRFEIQAKLPANSVPSYSDRQRRSNDRPELSLMLQSLLQDRFHLKTHHEKREIPVYTLTIGKDSARLKQSSASSDRLKIGDGSVIEFHGLSRSQSARGPDGTPRIQMTFQASSIQEAVDTLSWYLDRPVIDRTGLKGEYDFTMEVDVDRSLPQPDHVDTSSGRGGNYANPFSGVSSAALSAGLQDIGLKLESTKAPIEILVIDHVERPSEN